MSNLYGLTYVSESTRDLLPEEIDAILLDARLFNASVDVTGALLYSDGHFFQLLEGPEESVKKAFDRIQKAKSHHKLKEIGSFDLPERSFESWHMGFIRAPDTAIQSLSQAAWEDAIPYTRAGVAKSEGLGLLLYYWSMWAAEPVRSAP